MLNLKLFGHASPVACVDSIRGVFDQTCVKSGFNGIDSSVLHTKVKSQTAGEDTLDACFLQHLLKLAHAHGWMTKGWAKSRVRLDALVLALADDLGYARNIELWYQLSTFGALNAVIGP